MPSYYPCKKNDTNGFIFYVSLVSQASPKIFQANPTLAAGDIKVAIDDAGPANVSAQAVDADFTKRVKITLSQAQTNGDNLTVICSDAAGDEWGDLTINIQTAAQTLDELDTVADGIKAVTDVESGVKAAVDALQDPTVAAIADAVWDEVLTGATHNVATSAGKRLRQAGVDVLLIREDTCQNGATASTVILDSGASGTNNFYDHMSLILTGGTGAGQVRTIHNYVGSTQTADVDEDWLTTPDNTSTFTIIAVGSVHVHELAPDAVAQVNAEVDTALTEYAPPTKSEMDIAHALLATAVAVAALNDISTAEVNAEVVDALGTDQMSELSSVPASTPTMQQALMLVYMALRNKIDVTASAKEIHQDDGTVLGTKTLTDDNVTFSETKMA